MSACAYGARIRAPLSPSTTGGAARGRRRCPVDPPCWTPWQPPGVHRVRPAECDPSRGLGGSVPAGRPARSGHRTRPIVHGPEVKTMMESVGLERRTSARHPHDLAENLERGGVVARGRLQRPGPGRARASPASPPSTASASRSSARSPRRGAGRSLGAAPGRAHEDRPRRPARAAGRRALAAEHGAPASAGDEPARREVPRVEARLRVGVERTAGEGGTGRARRSRSGGCRAPGAAPRRPCGPRRRRGSAT